MEKRVKLNEELYKLDITLQIVDYLLRINEWGVRWYELREWVNVIDNGCCYFERFKVDKYKLWVYNNRVVRSRIGIFDYEICEYVSKMVY